jgi:predicted XRE-type DNA-binding protein
MLHFSNRLTSSLENLDGAVDRLRQETNIWLKTQGVKQNTVPGLLGVSEAFFSKFLSGEKDISAKTYAKLSYLVANNLELNAGARIIGLQEFGKKVGQELPLHARNMQITRERHTEELANRQRVNNLARLRGEQTL